jgi:hypothetical protein
MAKLTEAQLKDAARAHFKLHKTDKECYVTGDGTAFHVRDKNHASNHARSLGEADLTLYSKEKETTKKQTEEKELQKLMAGIKKAVKEDNFKEAAALAEKLTEEEQDSLDKDIKAAIALAKEAA